MANNREDPMHFLYHAAYLNEKGAALMKTGKQHEAFETFIAAVESVNTLTQLVESKRYHQHRTLSSLPSIRRRKQCSRLTPSSNCIISCDESFEKPCSTSSSLLGGSGDQVTFVYNQAFRFAPREMAHFESCDETLLHYIKLYRAILTFNSALTFHQRSIGANESIKHTAESVASNLYLDAMNLLRDCFSTLDSCRVLAATLNNAAMLFYEMQDFDRFECFQTELHRLLIDIETTFPKSVDPRCLRCLFFNATLLSAPKTAGAA